MHQSIWFIIVINVIFFISGFLCAYLVFFYKRRFGLINIKAKQAVVQRLVPLAENSHHKDVTTINLVKKICHDLNTPLATMEITLSIIRDDIDQTRYDLLKAAIQGVRNVSNNLVKSYQPLRE